MLGSGFIYHLLASISYGTRPTVVLPLLVKSLAASCRVYAARCTVYVCGLPCDHHRTFWSLRVGVAALRCWRACALWGCSTSGPNKTRTKRSLCAKRKLGPAAAAAHLHSTGGTVLRSIVTISGRATSLSASSCGQVLEQESRPKRRHSDTAWVVLTKLRVRLGLPIATMAE